ncbi:hypothetical protein HZC30_01260 [Candidatus Woesearchaeota archaeon]|nr:hypothetical protein [Candidatus Woesearchaeota archaeon]
METLAKTRRIGGSLVVTIPKEIVDEEGIMANQLIRVDVQKVRRSGFGMFKSLAPFTKEDQFRGQLEE